MAKQHSTFRSVQLQWLEVGPRVLALAEEDKENKQICTLLQLNMAEEDKENKQICTLLQLNMEEMDEG